MRELFEGSFRLELVHPFPTMDPADVERARPFMERLERFLESAWTATASTVKGRFRPR